MATSSPNLATPTKRLVVARADQIEPKPLEWLWPKRVPRGSITTFAGLPGEGKSLVAADIIARITRHLDFPDAENPLDGPRDALIIASEDDCETALVPRLIAAGADLSRVHIVQSVILNEHTRYEGERGLRLDADREEVRKVLNDNPAICYALIDPVTDSMGSVPMYKEQEVRALLKPLRLRGVSTQLIAHLNKKEGLAAIHRVGGAGAFVALARASWLFTTDPETRRHQVLPLKNNYATRSTPGLLYEIEDASVPIGGKAESVPRIAWKGMTDIEANDALDVATMRADAKAAAMEFLREQLADGRKETAAVEEAARARGISKRTLERAKATLRVRSEKDGQRWTWALPSGYDAL